MLKLEELNQLYRESDDLDQRLFAEQRSNILLVSGDHYQNRGSKFLNKLRDNRELSDQQKLRLTKNHTQRISKIYVSNILSHAPSVTVVPRNDKDLADQKSAELNKAVVEDMKDQYKLRERTREWCKQFIDIGEVAVKIFWDPGKGKLVGYHQATGDDGELLTDEAGQPAPDPKNPAFSGEFVFETIYGFNLFRAPEAQTMRDSRFIGLRKMVNKKDLEHQFADNAEALKGLTESADETYTIFDASQGSYKKADKQVMLREFYFRPCHEYPNGYFYITTPHAILAEGELPFGVFPIVFQSFEELPTTPRGRSMLKQLRPYQAEINRAASKIAEHQITLGDDKLLVQNGTKVTNAGQLPGVRALSYTGMQPTILAGRDGSQYLAYMQSQIEEMYEIAMVAEDGVENEGQLEPYTLLFRSLKNKKKFSTYGEKFENFLKGIFETALELARHYLPDTALVKATGKREYINIPEFRGEKEGYNFKVEPMSDDIDSQMGKQLTMSHILQYVGPNLGKDDIGKLIRNMPFSNLDQSWNDLTIDYDNATNDILALDRGEMPILNKSDTHEYIIKRLDNRMRQADFKLLSPQIQQNYDQYKQEHEMIMVEQKQEIERAQAGQVPTGGYLVTCDMYVPKKENPAETQRVRMPFQALEWLQKKREDQGMGLEKLEQMQMGTQAEMAQMYNNAQQQPPSPGPNGMGAMAQPPAQASAQGNM